MQQKLNPAVVAGIIVAVLAIGAFFFIRSANSGGDARSEPTKEGQFKAGYSGGSVPRPAPGGAPGK